MEGEIGPGWVVNAAGGPILEIKHWGKGGNSETPVSMISETCGETRNDTRTGAGILRSFRIGNAFHGPLAPFLKELIWNAPCLEAPKKRSGLSGSGLIEEFRWSMGPQGMVDLIDSVASLSLAF